MNKKFLLISTMGLTLALTGCAGNKQLNETLNYASTTITDVLGTFLVNKDGMALGSKKENKKGEMSSRKNVDIVYLRVKRELNMQSIDEIMPVRTMSTKDDWTRMSVEEDDIIHVVRPGLFYKMARNYDGKCYMTVTLEKNGKGGTSVYWSAKGYQEVCSVLVKDLKKAL